MPEKVILVMIDGLRDDTAAQHMGYMEHLVEQGVARRFTVIAEMPSVSRPLYETIHTGTPPHVHSVTSNQVVRRSRMPNVFEIAARHGKVTAAAAYCWISELYNAAPYDPVEHSEVNEAALAIRHGRFYTTDDFPDASLFLQAELLVRRFGPDYLLVHPMGMDHAGHVFGAPSREYDNHAVLVDDLLANRVPGWLERGYCVLVTADHGMNSNHMHGGSGGDVRRVPLYLVRTGMTASSEPQPAVSQLCIAPTVLHLLGLPIPGSMRHPSLV